MPISPPASTNTVSRFDEVIERSGTDSGKWSHYGTDVLPLWVADMDFASPQPIVDALQARAAQAMFGYASDPVELRAAVVARLEQRYGWTITPEMLVFLPGLVCGLNVVARGVGSPGDGILVNTPVYPPFLTSAANQARELHNAPLVMTTRHDAAGRPYLYYALDFNALAQGIQPNTRLFMLCNPHNPVGRVYTRPELERIADLVLQHDLIVCADEIHAEMLLDGAQHIPLASLSPEIAARTVTLIAPSKTFNVPGLGCSIAIIPDPALRKHMERASAGIVPHVNLMGYAAAYAAYTQCDDWLDDLLEYLTANRDFLVDYVSTHMPKVAMTVPDATYLAWLDFSAYGLDNPFQYFLDHAKVALSAGAPFGQGGKHFARLNFGCPRATLRQALDRMLAALPDAT